MKATELAQDQPPRDLPSTTDKLEEELQAFEAMRDQLLKTYRGLYVAIHRGRVIKSHADQFALAVMIDDLAAKEGPIAICKVDDSWTEDKPEYDVAESPFPAEDGV